MNPYDSFYNSLSLQYQSCLHILCVALNTPYWNSIDKNNTASNASLLYVKALNVVNNYYSSNYLLTGLKYDENISYTLPSHFSFILTTETSASTQSNFPLQLIKIKPNSSLEPQVGLSSLKKMVSRLEESVLTTSYKNIWKEEYLGTLLLCSEIWKSFLSSCNTLDDCISMVAIIQETATALIALERLMEYVLVPSSRVDEQVSDNEIQFEEEPHEAISSLRHSLQGLIESESDTQSDEEIYQNEISSLCLESPQWIPMNADAFQYNEQSSRVQQLIDINNTLQTIRELATDVAGYIENDNETFDEIEKHVSETDVETRQSCVELAEVSKTQAGWWGLGGSSAGAISGSILSFGLGPIGFMTGTSLGGMLGYRAGDSIRKRRIKKLDKIIENLSKKD